MNISINRVTAVSSYEANEKVADIVVSGGTSPYSYSLATGGEYFQISGTEVQVKAAMDISNIQSFSVTAMDSTSGAPTSITSEVIYPNITAEIQVMFNTENHIYLITNDIDLGHGVLTIPADCTLNFQGGKITNGRLILNSTKILPNGFTVGHYISATISGTWALGGMRWDSDFKCLEFYNGTNWEFVGSSPVMYEYKFDYYEALRALYHNEVYMNVDLYIGIVGLERDAVNTESISDFSTPSPKYSLAPGQTVYFEKSDGDRFNVLFYNSFNSRIATPADIEYDSNCFYDYTASGYTNFLKSLSDNISYGWIKNTSEDTTYLFSLATKKDYRLISDANITLNRISSKLETKGDTENRPSLGTWASGFEYYDTTLGKKILWNGTDWVNLDGTALE